MKLERLSEYLTSIVATLLGAFLAVYCGQKAGSGQMNAGILLCGGVVALMTALIMRAKIWLLIPLFWPMSGQLVGMGSLPARDFAIGYVFVVFLALKALKVVRTKPSHGFLDFLLFLNLFYVVTLYIRNPVGVASFGTELAGGRPYFEILFAAMAYWVVGHMTITPEFSRKLPLLMLAGDFLQAFFNFLTFHFPGTALIISKVYTGISPENFNAPDADQDSIRETYLAGVGTNQLRLICAYYPPLSTINPVYILRFLLFVSALYFLLVAGFRNAIFAAMCYFCLGSYFQRGIADIIRMAVMGIPILLCVGFLNGTLFELPYTAQRALSFMPGNWDPKAISDAEGSSEWRFEMWRRVWNSNKYISNWWLGDGFGISKDQLREAQMATEEDSARESATIAGDYHSGPLTAIKFAGYIGLCLIVVLMFAAAAYGWRLINRAKGTPFFFLALFNGCNAIYFPIKYFFIFGSYKMDLALITYSVTFMSLTSRSLDQWKGKLSQQKKLAVTNRTAPLQEFPKVFLDER